MPWKCTIVKKPRRHKEGRGGENFLALKLYSITDYQKLRYNCSLFVNTSFDPN